MILRVSSHLGGNMQLTDEDLIKAAEEVYELEQMLEPNKYCLDKAIQAIAARLEERITERHAIAAEELAAIMAKDDSPSEEAITALELFAHELRGGISLAAEEYEPQEDDVVQVILTGEVSVYIDECSHCGGDKTEHWSVTDRASGQEFFFEDAKNMTVRVISKGLEDYLV
jgi:hypothetical protein